MLHNKEGRRIAVIVNDVASVNIDSKLVSSSTEGASGMVELQNGCACCSLSDELISSVEQLVTLSDIRGNDEGFDHIVVELSGVADPKGIRSKFQEAVMYNMPVMDRVQLDTMVTVVDCSAFLDHLSSSKFVNPNDTPELFYGDGQTPPEEDDWTKDLPPNLVEALLAGGFNTVETTSSGVVDLLVSQTETADVVLLNKEDLSNDDIKEQIQQIVVALNPRAAVISTEFGRVPLEMILGAAGGMGVAMAGVVDDHKDAVEAAAVIIDRSLNVKHASDCQDADCTDPRHSRSHDHDCHGADCNDESHAHFHAHAHEETSHSHSHSHADDCNDPKCTDPSHSHATTLADTGIGSFVYRARRPFHPKRLVSFLHQMPLKRGVPDMEEAAPVEFADSVKDMLQNVVRSKGFAWCADSNVKALYWSHAGTSFDMQCLGSWWATLPRDQWPAEAIETVLSDFDDPNHDEQDPSTDSVGDRRQEVVLIGPRLGNSAYQVEICENLDKCLLTDAEWEEYKKARDSEEKLAAAFVSTIIPRMVSY
jgi:G3E family GTPase